MEEDHQMELWGKTDDGREKWHCPICDRVVHIRRVPYEYAVVREGDLLALHTTLSASFVEGLIRGYLSDSRTVEERSGLSLLMLEALEGLDWGDSL